MDKYKVMYYLGDSIDIKTVTSSGLLTISNNEINIIGDESIRILRTEIIGVELFRLHGLGRMIKITLADNKCLFISVIRCLIFGMFAIINFRKTGKLLNELQA